MWTSETRIFGLSICRAGGGKALNFYFLSMSSDCFTKIDAALEPKYEALFAGVKPREVASLEGLQKLVIGIHYVALDTLSGLPTAPDCEFNPSKLCCSCKRFRHIGICSHVLAISHLIEVIDLKRLNERIDQPRRKGGYRAGTRPALIRE